MTTSDAKGGNKRHATAGNSDNQNAKKGKTSHKKWKRDARAKEYARYGIQPGMSGILITCDNGKEKFCVKEAYPMLNQVDIRQEAPS